MLKNELHNTYCRIKLHLDLWSVSDLFFFFKALILLNANILF